uniref:Uncharacterized protein n=1 Tax=Amphimedon queenslandica TaxID=400682 RepID=A0A1X7UEB8_AMPQE
MVTLDLCYLRICIYIENSFPLYFLMLLLYINCKASHKIQPLLIYRLIFLGMLVICALTKLTTSEVNCRMTYLKSRKVKERRERFQ